MSSHDSGRPPHPARRPVLRKIGSSTVSAPPSAPPPLASAPKLSTRPPPDRSPSEESGASDPVPAPSRSAPRSRPSTPTLADTSDPFELLARPDRTSPGVGRILDSTPSVIPPPPPASAPGTTRPPPSIPSFDSPAPGTPLPLRTRGSLPPVVANAAGPQLAAPLRTAKARSARRAGLIGGALGLAFVTLFVVGTRIAYRAAPQVAATAPPPFVTAAAVASTVSPLPSPPSSPVRNVLQLPAAAEPTAVVRPQTRRTAPAARPSPGTTAAFKPSVPSGASDDTASLDPSAATAGAGTASASNQPDPANSAPSLVPVIPAGPAPEVDPLVKAVLEEDEPRRK
jgi:hypothetical protein